METNKTNYNFKNNENFLIGIDLFSVLSENTITSLLKKMYQKSFFEEELLNLENAILNIKRGNNKIYFLIPKLSENDKKNKELYDKLSKFLLNKKLGDKMIYYDRDFVGVCREYRFDIVCTKNQHISYDELDDVNKDVLKHKFGTKRNLFINECLPEYMQIILFNCSQELNNKFNNIYNISHVYELSYIIEKAKVNIKTRKDNIYKAYEFIPKTGIVSIDKEYKKYWIASKFENNIFEKITQSFSRYEFVKYHNRFNEDEEIIFIPSNNVEIKITKGERNRLVEKACHSFLEMGVHQGDVVTVCSPDSLSEYIVSLALNHIGAIVNPIHPLATTEKIEKYFSRTHPKYFVYFNLETKSEEIDLDYLFKKYNIERAIELSPVDLANPIIRKLYTLGVKRKIKHGKYKPRFSLKNKDKNIPFSKFLDFGKNNCQFIDINHKPSDTAYYYSTGGTTSGTPSIVDLPYSMINLSYYNSYGINIEKGDAVFINYPRYIAFSDENCTHLPDSVGMKMIMTPYEYPENFAQIIQKYKVKVLQMAPQFYEMMLDDEKKGSFDGIDLSSIKYVVTGGDKMDNVLKKKVLDFFSKHNNPFVQIIVGYGCTEVAGSSMVQLFDTNANTDEGNIGIPLPIFDVKLIDDNNKEVMNKQQKGRLLVGGTSYVMNGYLGDEEATRRVLLIDKNNKKWYDTADIVEFVPDMNLENNYLNSTVNFITREKRFVMITNSNCSGKAIPDDIEKLIVNNVEGVKQCCVVGIKENDEMLLKAAITMEDGFVFNDDIIEKIKLISSSKDILNTLADVICLEKMPLTERQKIKYKEVEEIFMSKEKQKCKIKRYN